MLETQHIPAIVHKITYDGKQDAPHLDGEADEPDVPTELSTAANSDDAVVTITFKVGLTGAILEEVERRYFPGVAARAKATQDKTRHYKDSLKFTAKEQTLEIFNETTKQRVLAVNGADHHPPMTAICKDGVADLYLRVSFRWRDSLNILKALDGSACAFTLQRTQAEFDAVLAAATANDAKAGKQESIEYTPKDPDEPVNKSNEVKFKCGDALQDYIVANVLEDGETMQDILQHIAQSLVDDGAYSTLKQVAKKHTFSTDDIEKYVFDAPPSATQTFLEKADAVTKTIHTDAGDGVFAAKGTEKPAVAQSDWDPYAATPNAANASDSASIAASSANGVPLLAPTASEKPVEKEQVDYRLCRVSSKKAKEELESLGESEEYKIGQHAALLAFDRAPAKGRKVQITQEDITNAKAALYPQG